MTNRETREPSIRIRIERQLPAPLMDGFDVGSLRAGHIYEVDERLARYLIVAGYAVAIDVDARNDRLRRKRQP